MERIWEYQETEWNGTLQPEEKNGCNGQALGIQNTTDEKYRFDKTKA